MIKDILQTVQRAKEHWMATVHLPPTSPAPTATPSTTDVLETRTSQTEEETDGIIRMNTLIYGGRSKKNGRKRNEIERITMPTSRTGFSEGPREVVKSQSVILRITFASQNAHWSMV